MATLEADVVINQPVEKVFAFAADSDNDAKWQSGVIETKRTPAGPVGVGTKVTIVRTFLGQRLESTYEITEYEPNKKTVFKSTSGPVKFTGTQTFEAVAGGTRVGGTFEIVPGGFFKIAEPLFVSTAKKQGESDFAKLKEVLEAMG